MSATGTGIAAGTLVALALATGRSARAQHRRASVVDRLCRDDRQPPPRSAALLHPPPWALFRLDDAGLPMRADVAWSVWCWSAVPAVFMGAVIGGWGLAAVAATAWCGLPVLVVGLRRGAAGRLVEAALPDALEGMARALRSGASTHQALAEVAVATQGRLGQELRRAVVDIAGGSGIEAALLALEQRRPEPGVRLAVAAVLLGVEAGGAHARALDGVAGSVRARLGVLGEVRALGSQARLSAVVIGAAPLGFAGLAVGTDRTSATFLLRTPLGLGCLALGLALDGVGAWWMHRLAQVDA